MSRKVEIGAPSLTGRGAELVVAAFAGATYPVSVMMTNHTPIEFSLPEAGGVFLRSVFFGNHDGNKQIATIHNEAQFSRLASSIEQICELNGFHYVAITIEETGANDPDLPADDAGSDHVAGDDGGSNDVINPASSPASGDQSGSGSANQDGAESDAGQAPVTTGKSRHKPANKHKDS